MKLLDGILGNVVGSFLGGGTTQRSANPLAALVNSLGRGDQAHGKIMLTAAMSLIEQNGGLDGLLGMFRAKGLASLADSWVSTGANASVSADQVRQVLGPSTLSAFASQAGTTPDEAGSTLAKLLPEIVNQFTPDGKIPDNDKDLLSEGLALLRRKGL